MTDPLRDDSVRTLIHLSGPVIEFMGRVRQRCAWCGTVLCDDDLTRMAYQLNEDGSDPGPPARGFPEGAFLEVTNAPGAGLSSRYTGLVEAEPSEEGQGRVKVPSSACMWLPAELTVDEDT